MNWINLFYLRMMCLYEKSTLVMDGMIKLNVMEENRVYIPSSFDFLIYGMVD